MVETGIAKSRASLRRMAAASYYGGLTRAYETVLGLEGAKNTPVEEHRGALNPNTPLLV
jgi:hypothetical protein